VGSSGIRCSARKASSGCRRRIRTASSPSTACSRSASARPVSRTISGSLATGSTATTTISSSGCSARRCIRCRPSSRRCARPSRPRTISTASGRSSSAASRTRARTKADGAVEHAAAMSEAEKLYDDEGHEYDAVLVVSFGGPEGPDDVMPFLDNVFRGLRVSDETKAAVAARYARFGGVSPINAETRAFIAALRRELDAKGPPLRIYGDNRNWHPYLEVAFERMSRDGVRRAIAYVTSVFSSYSSCRKYRENLYEAASSVSNPPIVDRLRSPFNHPLFIEAVAARVGEALERTPPERRDAVPILFTAHRLPAARGPLSPYEALLDRACRLVGDAIEHQRWRLVYQSNSGSYGGEPWLGPDMSEARIELA